MFYHVKFGSLPGKPEWYGIMRHCAMCVYEQAMVY